MFGKKPIESIIKKSLKIVDIFTKTVTELGEVNKEAAVEISIREEEIVKLNAEKDRLNSIMDDNNKVIEKITKILE